MRPLDGIRILDFSTLLPGPLATLILAEAGADVIKVERLEGGDEMRSYFPKFGTDSVNFAMLNRGKRSLAIDLKAPDAIRRMTPLLREVDVIVEQFRPGTLDRLGLGYEQVAKINPRVIYASITGWGREGPLAQVAAHDINFAARVGILPLTAGADGAPVLPALLAGDIAGGTYPAIINILLALRQRDLSGEGARIDIAIADNLFTMLYWALGNGLAADEWPRPGGGLITGGSPRYALYRTSDGRYIAAAPLEEKFWANFCDILGLGPHERDDAADPVGVRERIAAAIALKTAEAWQARFEGRDVCCSIVATLQEAVGDPQFTARGLFAHTVTSGESAIPALPVPLAAAFRCAPRAESYPLLGGDNAALLTD
jgi:crotonobetainyl-CoA:carnitine CoA-transferase CaiB-like acyl-CoA transferase